MNNPKKYQPVTGWLFVAVLLLACAASALAATLYVDVNSTNATPPYSNWATAATNIQDAVNAAAAGDEVVVTNGIYANGGRSVNGFTTNRVAVDKPLNLRSVNGPQFTTIDGGQSYRCAYLTTGATLSGFTLTNGSGGVRSESRTETVSNCVISGNVAYDWGGGAYGVTLNNCTLSNNWAFFHGGGAFNCSLNNCLLIGNTADDDGTFDASFSPEGGGAYYCTLNNCTLSGNLAIRWVGSLSPAINGTYGGGASSCTLNSCTLTGNHVFATDESGLGVGVLADGAGAYYSTLNNCILLGNWAAIYETNRFTGHGASACTMRYCIIGDAYDYSSSLDHCWTTNPLLVDYAAGNLRLQSNSPCINAGNNAYAPAGPDLDGNPRIVGGTVDIGAYEFQAPTSIISYAWLQQYGFPTDGSADFSDPDGDGVDNYHEWLAGTDPTNRFSSPAQLTIIPSGVPPSGIILTWSTNAVGFTLQSATDLTSTALWTTNLPAPVVIGGLNTVTNPIAGQQQFYRLVH